MDRYQVIDVSGSVTGGSSFVGVVDTSYSGYSSARPLDGRLIARFYDYDFAVGFAAYANEGNA